MLDRRVKTLLAVLTVCAAGLPGLAHASAPDGSLLASGGGSGTGWVILKVHGAGNLTFESAVGHPTGPGWAISALADENQSIRGVGAAGSDESAFEVRAHVASPVGAPVDAGIDRSVDDVLIPSAGLAARNLNGTYYLVGVVVGDAEFWSYKLTADSGSWTVLGITTGVGALLTSRDFQSTANVYAETLYTGAHATVSAAITVRVHHHMFGLFFIPPSIAPYDGVNFMSVTKPDGTVVDCPCTLFGGDGANPHGLGAYTFAFSGVGARVLTGERVSLIFADLTFPP